MKKYYLSALTILIVLFSNAQIVTIPDTNFKAALINHIPVIDTNGDGEIQLSEANSYNGTIDVANKSIYNLTGIEEFTSINKLYCSLNMISLMDLSNNIWLIELTCNYNLLDTLNLSNNTYLNQLACSNNEICTLDLSNNANLSILFCDNNQINSLSVSNSANLSTLLCDNNQINSLDLSNNTALTTLTCAYNQLNTLDLSSNTNLEIIACNNNQLSNLDVSANTNIEVLHCDNNLLSSLDVSSNANLSILFCDNNQLSTLDLSNNTLLSSLNCSLNKINSLDLKNNTELVDLSCQNNQLSSLDVRNGNNNNFSNFNAKYNTNLYCIEVDDPAWSTANWTNIDVIASFSADCSTGITGIKKLSALEVSPNPFSERININIEEAISGEIIVFDLFGKVILSGSFDDKKYTLSTSNLPTGTYVLQVVFNDQVWVEKIIKQ